MIKKFSAIALGVACLAGFCACQDGQNTLLELQLSADGQYYSVVSMGEETAETLVIPSSFQGKPIAEISESAFARCTGLKRVEIPSSVKKVGNTAFYQCTALESVVLSSGVEELGEKAFGNCSALRSFSIADSVTSFGESVFFDCTALETTEKDGAYYLGNEQNPYVVLLKTSEEIESCIIENGCKFLYDKCFFNRTALESIYMPNSVVQIGYKTFSGCSSLYGPILSDNVHTVGRYAFENCTALELITIGVKLKKIGAFAFYTCKLSKVYYRGTKEDRSQIEVNAGQNTRLNFNDAANGAKWQFEYAD